MIKITINYSTGGDKYDNLQDAFFAAAQKGVVDIIKQRLQKYESELSGKDVSITFQGKRTIDYKLSIKDIPQQLQDDILGELSKT